MLCHLLASSRDHFVLINSNSNLSGAGIVSTKQFLGSPRRLTQNVPVGDGTGFGQEVGQPGKVFSCESNSGEMATAPATGFWEKKEEFFMIT